MVYNVKNEQYCRPKAGQIMLNSGRGEKTVIDVMCENRTVFYFYFILPFSNFCSN